MKHRLRKLVSLMLALILSLALLVPAAYAEGDVIGPYERYPETIHVTSAVRYVDRLYDDGFTKEQGLSATGNLFSDYLLERSNIEVEYLWYTDNKNYDTKMSLAITSGDLPDVFVVRSEQMLKMLVESDMLEPLDQAYETKADQYIKDFYNSANNPFDVATFDGKLMALPDLKQGYEFSYTWVRKDWLDQLGLELPKTLDDCVTIAQAFVDNNMSGEGGMIGFPLSTGIAGNYAYDLGFDPVVNTFDAYPRSWMYMEDGSIAYGTIQPEMKEALAFMADLYQRGLIDREFATRDDETIKKLIATNKIGILFAPWHMPGVFMKNIKEINPDAEWVPVLAPLSDDGKMHPMNPAPHSAFLCVRKGYEHPEVAIELMNYCWQRGNDPKIKEIEKFYNESPELDGKRVLEPWKSTGLVMVQWFDAPVRDGIALQNAIDNNYDSTGLSAELTGYLQQSKDYLVDGNPDGWSVYASRVTGSAIMDDPEHLEFVDMCYPAFTDTMSLKWASMVSAEDEMMLKIIMGEEPIESFDTFVENWKRMGGDEITSEVNAMYANK